MGVLDDASFRLFIEALCWACEKASNGSTGLTEATANWAFRRDVTLPLHRLISDNLLVINEEGIICVNQWENRQSASDSSAERMRKHRAKKNVTVGVTSQRRPCDALEESRVEENRGDKIREEVQGARAVETDVELPVGFPKTDTEAKAPCGFVGCTVEFAFKIWNQAMARCGHDARGQPIRSWSHHLAAQWSYEKNRISEQKSKNKSGPPEPKQIQETIEVKSL